MAFGRVIWVFGLVLLLISNFINVVIGGESTTNYCNFPAIFNFGDSNSDTGGISSAISLVPPPNGETFFGKPSGRFCDGRLILDFIAEELGLPYLSAYLDSLGSGFKQGANFATGGSSIRQGGYSPFHLGIQINQFKQFKVRVIDCYNRQAAGNNTSMIPSLSRNNCHLIPKPKDFSKALYTLDIGQNDLAYGLRYTTQVEVKKSIPLILDQFITAVQELYDDGARAFWVHNTGPIGCLPYSVFYYRPSKSGKKLDEYGCVKPQNELAQEFNKQLKDRLTTHLRSNLTDAMITYVDVYSAKYDLISTAHHLGFVNPLSFCCGSYYGYHVNCGQRVTVNGTVYGDPCNNPAAHISWDGIHYSQAANWLVAKHIINGSLSDPPISITGACLSKSH